MRKETTLFTTQLLAIQIVAKNQHQTSAKMLRKLKKLGFDELVAYATSNIEFYQGDKLVNQGRISLRA